MAPKAPAGSRVRERSTGIVGRAGFVSVIIVSVLFALGLPLVLL